MLKEEGSEILARQIKSQRERELEELRSRGVAKTRRQKLKDYSVPLQTALESKQFLLQCHGKSRKRMTLGMPELNPSTVSAVDYNSFLMQQSKKQRELKTRRREAEQLLHGFRGFYGESFASWSPRHARKEKNFGLFGFPAEDSLRDPDDSASRRSTALSQVDSEWGETESRDDDRRYGRTYIPKPLDPSRGDFLLDERVFDGTQYPRTKQEMEVQSGVVMFSPRGEKWQIQNDNQFRERPPSTTRSSTSAHKAYFENEDAYSRGEFAVGFDENQFRQRPPSTTKSSNSTGRGFFQDSKDNCSVVDQENHRSMSNRSSYEPQRMKLHDPRRNKSFDRDSDGFGVEFDENAWKRYRSRPDEEVEDGEGSASEFPYEPQRYKLLQKSREQTEDGEDIASKSPYDPQRNQLLQKSREQSEDSEEIVSESPYDPQRNQLLQKTGKKSHENVDRHDDGFTVVRFNGNKTNRAEHARTASNFSHESQRMRVHNPTNAFNEGVDRNDDRFAAVGFDDNNNRQISAENPEERETSASKQSYKERRMLLKINTERDEVIDVTASKERIRQADGQTGSNRGERLGLSKSLSDEDSRTLRTLRVDNQTQKIQIAESASQEEVVHYENKPAIVPETIWRDFVSDEPGSRFPPEAGRYHLYASYACPGSHRALIVRALKGLEDVVSVTIVHPTWRHTNREDPTDKHRGWIFGDPNGKPFHNTMGRGGPFPPAYPDNTPDPILNAFSVRNLYEYAQDTSGKYTIPLLWDKKLNTIVNNESSDISYMLNSSFNKLAKEPELDLYTEDDDDGLDRLNEVSQWLYPMMIHGVYRCGFAKTQRAYDKAIEELTAAFDAADELLQRQRYLTGDTLTDADIRFFVTLLRFDEVYAFYFRANTRLVLMTPSLLNFCREIYQMPGVAITCQMDQIKAHFFGSHAEWNKYSVVPRGLGFMRYLEMPHDRENISSLGHC